jgi:primosomal protein N' (replication factor Y)
MSRYVDVLPDPGRALSQVFTYDVPERLRPVPVGAQVLVPFGPRSVVGVVVSLREESERAEVRELEAVFEDVPALPRDAIPLARWLADHYLCELGEALRPFLPHGGAYRIGRHFRLTGQLIPCSVREHRDAGPLLRVLQSASGEVSLAALRRASSARPGGLARGLRLLKSQGLVSERASLLPPEAKPWQVGMLEVAVSPEEAARYCEEYARRAPARVSALRAALEAAPVSVTDLAGRAGVSPSAVQALVRQGLLRSVRRPVRRVPWPQAEVEQRLPPTLTPEQTAAVRAICQAADAGRFESFLLYGVTASGKTEVFLRVMDHILPRGRQAIVLLPEISLTAQAVSIYRARFGDRVAILHSGLSLGERWDEWQRIEGGEAQVVLGARSALFAPTHNLGLIVMDEEHESSSYKQEQAPRYHAREVALARGGLAQCPVVLASATPSLEAFHDAQRGRHRLLRLPTRVEDRPMPTVRVVDVRASGPRPAILSTPLRQAIAARLRAGDQVILFLNRRGFATFLLCPACGEAVRCPECRVSLTYHREAREVRCHHCGFSAAASAVCARCGGHNIRFSGFGTERVEKELAAVFPQARSARLDRDTTAQRGSHLRIVGEFRAARTNILIGTQMVAKGFDFPGVTLVGVVSADTSLNLPDFRAAERTFQLLTQVSGRSGRGEKEGEVVVQTFRPNHYSVVAAAQQDYEAFYRREIEARRELDYPPFSRLANLIVSSEREDQARERAQWLADHIRSQAGPRLNVLGPAAAPISKLRGRYRWHLVVRASGEELQAALREALSDVGDSAEAGLTVDVDPVSLM